MSLPDSVCLVSYHRPHYKLYILLFCAIYRWYLLQLPTPASMLLNPLGIPYWSEGMTRASTYPGEM